MRFKQLAVFLIMAAVALSLPACGKEATPTDPAMSQLGLSGLTTHGASEGSTVKVYSDYTPEISFRADIRRIDGALIKTPVTVSMDFVFTDGTVYVDKTMVYGPFVGVETISVYGSFHISNGLLAFARERRGQRTEVRIHLSGGETFNLFGFYFVEYPCTWATWPDCKPL